MTGRGTGLSCAACTWLLGSDDRYCARCGVRQPKARDRIELSMIGVAGVSDRGHHHPLNEDALATRVLDAGHDGVSAAIAVLSDGVSRATHSDLVARTAAETGADELAARLRRLVAADRLDTETAVRDAAAAAHRAVLGLVRQVPQPGMLACTFITAVVIGGSVTVGWVGDSRAYWLPTGPQPAGAQMTRDDSRYAQLVASGRMSPSAAASEPGAHALTAWLGTDAPDLDVHVLQWCPTSAGTLVLCTDGLSAHLPTAAEIRGALRHDPARDALAAARDLVAAALLGGGEDNITVAVLPLGRPASAPRVARPAAPPTLYGEVHHDLRLPAGADTVQAVLSLAAGDADGVPTTLDPPDPDDVPTTLDPPGPDSVPTTLDPPDPDDVPTTLDRPAAEVIVVDESVPPGGSLAGVSQVLDAAAAAIDLLPDGVRFALVAGAREARVLFPADGDTPARADERTRRRARAALARVDPTPGREVGRWLELARDLLPAGSGPAGRVRLLLRPGAEVDDRLAAAVDRGRGAFRCEVRTVGDGDAAAPGPRTAAAPVRSVERVTGSSTGRADAALDGPTPPPSSAPIEIGLRIWTPVETSLESITRIGPPEVDLTGRRTAVDEQVAVVPVGCWSGEPVQFRIRLRTRPGAPGRERLCGRIDAVQLLPDGQRRPLEQHIARDRSPGVREWHPAALISVTWSAESPGSCSPDRRS